MLHRAGLSDRMANGSVTSPSKSYVNIFERIEEFLSRVKVALQLDILNSQINMLKASQLIHGLEHHSTCASVCYNKLIL